jgi:hypothetical protein
MTGGRHTRKGTECRKHQALKPADTEINMAFINTTKPTQKMVGAERRHEKLGILLAFKVLFPQPV